jgi:hypothetical protein
MKLIASLALITSLSLLPTSIGCKPGSLPSFATIEQTVLDDIKIVGETAEKIEADIAPFLAPGSDVVVVLDDALILLSDLGLIPSPNLPAAQAMHVKLAAQRGVAAPMALKGFVAAVTPAK